MNCIAERIVSLSLLQNRETHLVLAERELFLYLIENDSVFEERILQHRVYHNIMYCPSILRRASYQRSLDGRGCVCLCVCVVGRRYLRQYYAINPCYTVLHTSCSSKDLISFSVTKHCSIFFRNHHGQENKYGCDHVMLKVRRRKSADHDGIDGTWDGIKNEVIIEHMNLYSIHTNIYCSRGERSSSSQSISKPSSR